MPQRTISSFFPFKAEKTDTLRDRTDNSIWKRWKKAEKEGIEPYTKATGDLEAKELFPTLRLASVSSILIPFEALGFSQPERPVWL